MAYCLIGIFDVKMPLLYGERIKKAFIRLQEEIMRSSDDQSIFAWVDEKTAPDKLSGLLATDPKYFLKSKNIESIGIWAKSDPFETTNKGLRVQLYLARMDEDGKWIACLDCRNQVIRDLHWQFHCNVSLDLIMNGPKVLLLSSLGFSVRVSSATSTTT
jgi:hypothetical protein